MCALVLGAVGVGALWPRPDDATATRTVSPATAAQVVSRLDRALVTGDVAAAEALAPSGDAAARAALVALVDNARALRLRHLSVRFVGLDGQPSASGPDRARVRLTWQIPGFDRRPARVDTTLGVRVVGDRVALTVPGREPTGGRLPVWWSGPVRVARGEGVLVLARPGSGTPRAAEIARAGARARDAVRRVLPGWHGGLVIEVPDSSAALDAALGAPAGEHAAIAAVTAPVDGSAGGRAPTHVLLNPEVFGAQGGQAAQAVLAHEATHVATGAASTAPGAAPWLVEGFADYVALRDLRLPTSVLTRRLARQVGREGVPDRLPGPAAFDARAAHLGATYESSWLACRLIARRAGEPALVAVYADVRAGVAPGPALRRRTTDLTLAGLTVRWQRRLSSLAAASG